MYKIMIPYRDRQPHLEVFADKGVPFFEDVGREYKIILVEQVDGKPFNLGKLTNAGFDIFKKQYGPYGLRDSFIFQPVDCIPYDAHYDAPRNGIAKLASHYSTPREQDASLAIGFDRPTWEPRKSQVPQGNPRVHGVPFHYKAFSIDPVAYEKVNGFNNDCWGWGGEDDEFFVRLRLFGIKNVHRLCLYDMLDHELASLEYHGRNIHKAHIMVSQEDAYKSGLNNLEYEIVEKTERCGIETYVCKI